MSACRAIGVQWITPPLPTAAATLHPQGGQGLTFSGEGSRDPDDRAGRTPLRYSWSCTKTDAAAKASADVPAMA